MTYFTNKVYRTSIFAEACARLVIEITAVSLSRISVCAVKSAAVALNVISGSPATFVNSKNKSFQLPSTILSSVIATGILTLVAPAGIVTVPDKQCNQPITAVPVDVISNYSISTRRFDIFTTKFTVPASSLKLAPGLVIEIVAVSLSRISVCAS